MNALWWDETQISTCRRLSACCTTSEKIGFVMVDNGIDKFLEDQMLNDDREIECVDKCL